MWAGLPANVLLRKASEGLTSQTAIETQEWMTCSSPNDVDAAYQLYFEELAREDGESKPPNSVMRAQDAAWQLMAHLSARDPSQAPAFEIRAHPPSFTEVRLQTHVVAFSQDHVAGPRGLPPGAAGRPPGRPAIVKAGGVATNKVDKRPSRPPPVVHANGPAVLQPCPIHTPLECSLALRNVGRRKAIVSVRPLQSLLDGGYVSVEPPSLVLGRGEIGTVTVALRLLHPGREVKGLLVIEAEGGPRQLAVVRAQTERTVFGVDLCDVPISLQPSGVGGYTGLPAPLVHLEARLLADNSAAMDEEGIFRVATTEAEKDAIRRQLDAGSFSGTPRSCTGIAAAVMTKVFLRELPSPLFSAIPKEALLATNLTDDAAVLALFDRITGPARSILLWLRDLLRVVASHEPANKMSLKALAICTGPNLFVTDESVNPMEALMISQKAVALLLRLCMIAQAEQLKDRQAAATETMSVADFAPARAPVSAGGSERAGLRTSQSIDISPSSHVQ